MKDVLLIRSSAFKTMRLKRQADELYNSGYNVKILHWERLNDQEHNLRIIDSLLYSKNVAEYKKKCSYGKGIYSFSLG